MVFILENCVDDFLHLAAYGYMVRVDLIVKQWRRRKGD